MFIYITIFLENCFDICPGYILCELFVMDFDQNYLIIIID